MSLSKSAISSTLSKASKEQFKIVTPLNESTFPIYLITSKDQTSVFALKVFPYQSASPSQYFLNESKFSGLSHNNVAKIDRVFSKLSQPNKRGPSDFSAIVMELAPYGDFSSLLLEGDEFRPEMEFARTYFRQMIEGLEYLHNQGIAHFDLKLDNLLLGDNFQLKICDFDCATLMSDEVSQVYRGSLGYRAPEVRSGRIVNHAAVDLYSVGIVLFALVTGSLPYEEKSGEENFCDELYELMMSCPSRFWEAQRERVRCPENLTDDFKILFEGLVHNQPSQRTSIEKVKSSSWFNGPVISSEELTIYMEKWFPEV